MKLSNLLTTKYLYITLLHIALLVLASEVVILAKQNREMKQSLAPRDPMQAGDSFSTEQLEPLKTGYRLDKGKRMVLLMFTTTCPYCEKNIPLWKQILQEINLDEIAIVGISLDTPESTLVYTEEKALEIPIYYALDAPTFKKENKVLGVPTTVILDAAGNVENVWTGLLSENQTTDIVAAIRNE